MRLNICALLALVITISAAQAQTAPDTDAMSGQGETTVVRLGGDKAAPLCPHHCVTRRATTPEQAGVGEREVLTLALARAGGGARLRIDNDRSALALVEKFPSMASSDEMPAIVTQDAFRPGLDPVLAEPTPDSKE